MPATASASATTGMAPAPTERPSSVPVIRSRPAGGGFRGRRTVILGVFRRMDANWVHLGDLPEMEIGEATALKVTTVMGRVYVMIADAGRGPNRLGELSDGTWRPIKLSKPVADDIPLSAQTISSHLVVALSGPADPNGQRGVSLAELDANSGVFTVRKVLIGKTPFTLPLGTLPLVTRQDNQLAMLWRDTKGLAFGTCDVAQGQLAPKAKTVDVFEHKPEGKEAIEMMAYFTWVVVILVFTATILMRPRGPIEPFVLPAGTRPGSIFKRLIALAIDLAPCMFVVGTILSFAIGEQRTRELYEQASRVLQADKPVNVPVEMAIWAIALLATFVVYCMITEARFGATPGKKLMRLRVVGTAGMPATFRQCLIRNLMKIVELSMISPMILFVIVTMVVVITRYNQRLGDLLARTAVVDATSLPAFRGPSVAGMPPLPSEMQQPPEEQQDEQEQQKETAPQDAESQGSEEDKDKD